MRVALILFAMVLVMCGLTVVWWRWTDRQLRHWPTGIWLRVAVAMFAVAFMFGLGGFLTSRLAGWSWSPPGWWIAGVMLWALLMLPLVAFPLMTSVAAWRFIATRFRASGPSTPSAAPMHRSPQITRRQMLTGCVALAPMILTVGSTVVSMRQSRAFRIRRLIIEMPRLPEALDGMTIAHVSDTHVGKFTNGDVLDRIAAATNELNADLVLFTGDLIDTGLREMPEALAMVNRIHRRGRFFMIEGNHDLFDGREAFEQAVRAAGLPLLLDEATTVHVRSHPVQIMGIRWHTDRTTPGSGIAAHVDRVASMRDPAAFPILLAHHPHAFDRAAELGIPLTLAGHTHGGQLMLTPHVGAGPMLFRYWSGLYRQQEAQLVVNNGAGNWFPLRTNAPAEILHLTLRRV